VTIAPRLFFLGMRLFTLLSPERLTRSRQNNEPFRLPPEFVERTASLSLFGISALLKEGNTMIDPAIVNFFSNLTSGTLYFLFGSILTGVFTWKVVIPRIMRNKDIQELKTIALEIRDELKKRRT